MVNKCYQIWALHLVTIYSDQPTDQPRDLLTDLLTVTELLCQVTISGVTKYGDHIWSPDVVTIFGNSRYRSQDMVNM